MRGDWGGGRVISRRGRGVVEGQRGGRERRGRKVNNVETNEMMNVLK